MNKVYQANINAIIGRVNKRKKGNIVKNNVTLNSNSTSAKIIKFLINNGATSGTDLIDKLNLKYSPKAFINPHIKQNRILITSTNGRNNIYKINPNLPEKYFLFK